MDTSAQGPWRLSCIGFNDADQASLRSLLGLLAPYLRHTWKLVDAPAHADLCLIRLDGESPNHISHPRMTGCAQRPREHPAGTLHRPLRAAQLLALLSETGTMLSAAHTPAASQQGQPLLRLLAWPLDFPQRSQLTLHVLAALSAGPTMLEALASRLDIPNNALTPVIDALCRDGFLVMEKHATAPSPPPTLPAVSHWGNFIAGLGRRLGLSLT